jgi:predicted ribosomally synthesized peptide with SipW-like signal peptide
MKSIFLSVVVISALAIAGIGGTFATWSDSETSMGNKITTGSVDLKVNDADDQPWGTGVPTKVKIDCMVPCKWYGPFEVELWNAGICESPSHAFIHFKDMCCSNAPPKEGSGYRCPVTGDLKPEPELVAEQGGKVDCREVKGIGVLGDTCSMKSHVACKVSNDRAGEDLIIKETKLIDLECQEIPLFDLMPCEPRTIYLWFHLQQPSEEDFDLNYFPNPGEAGYDELEYLKFNDWPSWALMRDVVSFSIEFDLWLEDPPANGGLIPKYR